MTPAGIEPTSQAPQAYVLSVELRGRANLTLALRTLPHNIRYEKFPFLRIPSVQIGYRLSIPHAPLEGE